MSESEVRSFLKRVADEMTSALHREHELRDSLAAAEKRADHREPLDESELLEALGEETAKLLRSAREAARDIRAKAEDNASRVRTEAADEAAIVRAEAGELLELRRGEADTEIAELRQRIEAEVSTQRDDSAAEIERERAAAAAQSDALLEHARVTAESRIDEAKTTGRTMVEEAKTLRERILADLGHRRGLLQGQIAELKVGREHLLDAYRTVKRTFLEATSALSEVEARAAENRPDPVDAAAIAAAFDPAIVEDTAPELGAELLVETDTNVANTAATELDSDESVPIELDNQSDVDTDADPDPSTPQVGDLFARIRAQASDPAQVPDASLAPLVDASVDAVTEPESEPESEVASEVESEVVEPAAVEPEPVAETTTDPALVAVALSELVSGVVKRAKRVLQDEQNEMLDTLRRQKGRAQSSAVLPESVQTAAWEATLLNAVREAFTIGSTDSTAMPGDLLSELCREMTSGLRARLADAIDTGDADGLNDRVNARFREWKTQDLEALLADALHGAYVNGVFVSIPAGAATRWVMSEVCCADCADNALESVLKGAEFPTGHVLPPAHAGCRCIATSEA